MELNYVVDITSAYNDVLMTYGDNYQVQRYTHGIDQISMDFWMLDDHDNGWIPNGSEMNLSGERQRLYYLHDELGSVTKVIGENGKTSAHYNYDEFGRPLPSVKFDQNWPGPDNTFGYTGYQYDASAELWYAGARYYMPEIGRFISEDPWSGTIVTPTTMNPYPYVLNNPLKYVDPLGLKQQQQGWTGYTVVASENQVAVLSMGIDTFNIYGHSIIDKINNLWYQVAPVIEKGAEFVVHKGVYAYEGIKNTIFKASDDKASSSKDKKSEEKSKGPHFKTTKEATEAAEKLGFEKTNEKSHGQPVYKKGKRYITPNADSHNGGAWKMADSVKKLGSKKTRLGIYDTNLNRIGD